MKSPSFSIRLLMVACAMMMLAGQLMGLHFHRHLSGGDAGFGHGLSLHLRDADVHSHAAAQLHDHHAIDDRAAHPDDDVEIDPLAAGLAKLIKIWVAPCVLLLALLWCLDVRWSVLQRVDRPVARRHPSLFVLRPPSHAPPLKLSLVR